MGCSDCLLTFETSAACQGKAKGLCIVPTTALVSLCCQPPPDGRRTGRPSAAARARQDQHVSRALDQPPPKLSVYFIRRSIGRGMATRNAGGSGGLPNAGRLEGVSYDETSAARSGTGCAGYWIHGIVADPGECVVG